MPQQQSIVGYDPSTGRAVVGYDPATGKAIFAQQSAPLVTAPSKPGPTAQQSQDLQWAAAGLPTSGLAENKTERAALMKQEGESARGTLKDMLVTGATTLGGGAVSSLARGLPLAARMAVEGATMAGISKASGGDATTAGVIGAAIPAVGGLAAKLPPALREAAEKKVAQALGATKEKFKAIAAKRAPEILKRGLSGSRQTLLADATENARDAGRAIDDVLKAHAGQVVPTGPVIDALEQAKAGFQVSRSMPLAEAVKSGAATQPGAKIANGMVEVPIMLDSRPIEQLTKLQGILRELGDEATTEQVVAARRVWDTVVSGAGGYAHRAGGGFGAPLAEQSEAWAKREATNAIRKVLAEEIPDLTAVNKEFAFWKDLKSVLTATEKRTQAQGPGLNRMVSATIGSGVGGMTGDSATDRIKNAFIGGIVGPKAYQMLTSTRWRLVDANLRNQLADAIASGSAGRITGMIARIAAVAGGQAASPSTPERKVEHR